ncbi:MAG: hypothetical protein ACE5HD_04800 [Acidobacteriota bacterium]
MCRPWLKTAQVLSTVLVAVTMLLFPLPSAAQMGDLPDLLSGDLSGSNVDHSAEWDAMARQIDLTGLWPFIDVLLDADPVSYVHPSTGRLYLFWAKWNGMFSEIVFASRPTGGAWGQVKKVEPVPSSTYNNVTPDVVADADGRVNVVWTRESDSGGVVFHSLTVSGFWTVPLRLSGPEDARRPLIWVQGISTFVSYVTPTDEYIVEVVVTIFGSSGGSDDIDPTEVNVTSSQVAQLPRLR